MKKSILCWALVAGSLGACTAATEPTTTLAPTAAPLRVVVQFKQSGDYRSPALLQRLEAHTQARVQHITFAGPNAPVYGIQPAMGQSDAQLLQRLQTFPGVERVEIDQRAR